ncbi:hypothetical protein HZU77_016230 [Neisseriaceae bacterium TC5R-5]|nr:hypothetical protein [Neisseriaceae bacterium TC5R-5]
MIQFPHLGSVSFNSRLPLYSERLADHQCQPALMRECWLALRVLAASAETPNDTDPMLIRLEAKLDMALEIALQAHHPQRPPLTPCSLGLENVAWLSAEAPQIDSMYLLFLYPQADSALLLPLLTRIEKVLPDMDSNGHIVCANISHNLDQAAQLLWEKWVFRQHRKDIQERG